jgi:hypothetical protein
MAQTDASPFLDALREGVMVISYCLAGRSTQAQRTRMRQPRKAADLAGVIKQQDVRRRGAERMDHVQASLKARHHERLSGLEHPDYEEEHA